MAAPLTQRPVDELQFSTHDGVSLFYRHWPATSGPRRGAIVLFHRGHEHGARMAHLVDELNLPDFDLFAWDARGHGRSPGQRGHSPSFADSVRDVQTFVDHIANRHGVAEADQYIVAQSVGAVLVSTWAHDYAPRVRGMTLASPAFKVKLYVPFARPGLALMHKLRGLFFVNSYVKPQFLTHDDARIASYRTDPLITRPIAVNILLELYQAAERVVQDANAIVLPTQLLISGADWVVHHAPQHRFFERLGSAVKEKIELPGFFHDTLGERDRAPAVARVRAFILQQFDAPAPPVNLLDADQHGATADEARALAAPLPALSPRGLYWGATRAGLKLGGLLSDGVKLGHETGFDSGSTLDYVYRNQAAGAPLVGPLIDRTYLDSIGWRGIRQRKLHVEALLHEAMQRLQAAGQAVRVMDIAAGHGRYVLDAVAGNPVAGNPVAGSPVAGGPVTPESILLRDYSALNVQGGQRLIAERGLQGRARFEQADAFDRASLAAVTPRPTLAVVSGLYELFPDNALVRRSLAGVADAVDEGGYLVYTGQPWHPQLEMIARALTSHRRGTGGPSGGERKAGAADRDGMQGAKHSHGEHLQRSSPPEPADARVATPPEGPPLAWVMRRRTQAEMDQLVAAAGFRKLTQRVDRWGIFTVSLAVRVAS
ncbi:bifunctional alpha/beta hydrolase/class I SAM-dependent methyltransferase [Comamonas serinivorans]|uniref:bifunctional alpha/beta hydrolase/class I SAM-dependent methyltransferase n=1 Tax=Comamonas serinivorans TaxID=1082851 RepID=UPI001F4266C1|nr:bifunctional alpha/beta hydrolase/class I SAM-dependent methyltransferase [Comamonas serinivorans]